MVASANTQRLLGLYYSSQTWMNSALAFCRHTAKQQEDTLQQWEQDEETSVGWWERIVLQTWEDQQWQKNFRRGRATFF